jgi:Short-chain dehydrogenases of various substrate specificities
MKNAIVTGASNGIGLEISKKLSENDYHVGMIDVDKENLFKESENISNSVAIEGDVTNEDSIKNALDIFNKTPDLIVNNAGIVIFGGLEEQSIEDFKKSVDVSLIGSYLVSRLAIASMIKKNSGCIINMSSINGVHPGPGTGGYPPAKAGIVSLTQTNVY